MVPNMTFEATYYRRARRIWQADHKTNESTAEQIRKEKPLVGIIKKRKLHQFDHVIRVQYVPETHLWQNTERKTKAMTSEMTGRTIEGEEMIELSMVPDFQQRGQTEPKQICFEQRRFNSSFTFQRNLKEILNSQSQYVISVQYSARL